VKHFIKYILLIVVSMTLFIGLWHAIFLNYWSTVEKVEKRTWIWGDSQMIQGLDPSMLDLDKTPFSVAKHGNGYYDLISFAHCLPEKGNAIVGIGPLYYRYQKDRSEAGFQLDALRALFEAKESNAFSVDLKEIMRTNVRYEFSMSGFKSIRHGRYSNEPDSTRRLKYIGNILEVIDNNEFEELFEFKDRWMRHAFDELSSKSSRFHIISWPVCQQLIDSRFSLIQNHYDSNLSSISSDYNLALDTVYVDVKVDPFHDATHFSSEAVDQVSNQVKEELKEDSSNRILVIRFRHLTE
jgi:hypothetical protein